MAKKSWTTVPYSSQIAAANPTVKEKTVRASMSPDSSVTKDQIVLISMQRISSTPPSVASKTEPAPNFKLESRDRRLMHHQPNGDADRRFPPPWSADVTTNCFIVRDATGQAAKSVSPSLTALSAKAINRVAYARNFLTSVVSIIRGVMVIFRKGADVVVDVANAI